MIGPRIRLLYLQPAPLFGGAERQAAEQASYLPEFGVDVTVMAGPGGYVTDMPSFYAACDLIVLPSRSEGSSNMLLEAMACGRPVVASDIPPLREQLERDHVGLTYPLGNVEELTRAVRGLIH